eukprot:3154943-Pyramimonas_sp.AAC.1
MAFEQIRHDNMLRLAQKFSFPLCLLKPQLDIYTKARALVLDGAVSDLVYVRQTVLAGDSFATTFMELQLIGSVDRMQQAVPTVSPAIVVDDLVLQRRGGERRVMRDIVLAAQ